MYGYSIDLEKNISSTFGSAGILWLQNLEEIIGKCKKRWNLSNCQTVGNLSFNYVCTAESPEYGDVILKIGVLENEILSEVNTLKYLKSSNICSCYDYDRNFNAMLLERILPGNNLYSIGDIEKQIKLGSQLVLNRPATITEEISLSHYRDWLDKAFTRAENEKNGGDKLYQYINRAKNYYKKIECLNEPDKVLHGDFHHQNILKNSNGSWTLIDPKGVIGKHPLESGRFVINQLAVIEKKDHRKYFKFMVDSFAETLRVSREIIVMCSFIESVLACCWTLEGELEKNDIEEVLSDVEYKLSLYSELLGNNIGKKKNAIKQ